MATHSSRRQFLGRVTYTIGGVTLASCPVSLLQAAPSACLVDAKAWPDACGDWQLDDICLAYPPYAMAARSPVPVAAAIGAGDPIDSHWLL
ncbi:MAG TPA: hypothetical protein VN645_12235 [Steroidobacteraceae bacterium]|nr:hypothetical protein [Steroidobacteraceae bacterium]